MYLKYKQRYKRSPLILADIDILVNNAGIAYTATLSETPLEDWQQVINLNLTSVFQCIKGILPGMRDRSDRHNY